MVLHSNEKSKIILEIDDMFRVLSNLRHKISVDDLEDISESKEIFESTYDSLKASLNDLSLRLQSKEV